MPSSLIGLGANLGDRKATLARAVVLLSGDPQVQFVTLSNFHETRPVGGPSDQGVYLNAALLVETSLPPAALHQVLVRIEHQLGRTRGERWGARTVDLDLLLHGDAIVNTEDLQVPHPRMTFRRFVLVPAAEVAARMVHPLSGLTLGELLGRLSARADYVAVLGMPGESKTTLGRAAARASGGAFLPRPAPDWPLEPAPDPSGPALARSIQFVDRAAAVLAADAPGTKGPVISDFYFDECLAYARGALDEEHYEQLRGHWQQRRATVASPRLLVVLDAWRAAAAVRTGEARQPRGAMGPERLRYELVRLSLGEDQGPVVYAGAADFDSQLQEITAAMAAMQ